MKEETKWHVTKVLQDDVVIYDSILNYNRDGLPFDDAHKYTVVIEKRELLDCEGYINKIMCGSSDRPFVDLTVLGEEEE